MKFRKLRIAWSVVCGIATVLLIVLWARSYWWYECIGLNNLYFGISLSTGRGKILYQIYGPATATASHWYYVYHPVIPGGLYSGKSFFEILYGHGDYPYRIYLTPGLSVIPYWLLVAFAALLAPLPWLRWRFTPRTLLIATTLVAVVLGLIVWLVR
jgi:hypothetical protein